MKRIFNIIALASVVLLSACKNLNTTPVFNEDDSFVAMDKLSFSIPEDGGVLRIPVSVASIDPMATVVGYKTIDGTAKDGVNFKLVDESALLTFDGKSRQSYIEVQILDNPGVFTGDITFQLELTSAKGMNLGYNKLATITITDNDHPLSAMLGTWVVTHAGGQFEMEIMKDPKDTKVVWFYNFPNLGSWAGDDIMYYGNATWDAATGTGNIVVPFGQESEYKYSNGNAVTLCAINPGFTELYDGGTFEINFTDNGNKFTIDMEDGWYIAGYIFDAGTVSRIQCPITAVKK